MEHGAPDGRPTLPDVRQLVADAGDWRNLMRALVESPDEDAREIANGLMVTAANERLLGSIFATFRANLRFLCYPAVRESLSISDFSLSALTTAEPVALFLQFEESAPGDHRASMGGAAGPSDALSDRAHRPAAGAAAL